MLCIFGGSTYIREACPQCILMYIAFLFTRPCSSKFGPGVDLYSRSTYNPGNTVCHTQQVVDIEKQLTLQLKKIMYQSVESEDINDRIHSKYERQLSQLLAHVHCTYGFNTSATECEDRKKGSTALVKILRTGHLHRRGPRRSSLPLVYMYCLETTCIGPELTLTCSVASYTA